MKRLMLTLMIAGICSAALTAQAGEMQLALLPDPPSVPMPAASVKVTVYPQSLVRDEQVLLEDIAKVETKSDALAGHLRKLALDRLSEVEKPQRITENWLRSRLRAAGVSLRGMTIECPNTAVVERVGTDAPVRQIERAVQLAIQEKLGALPEQMVFRPAQMGRIDRIPVGKYRFQVDVAVTPQKLGRVPFNVDLQVDGRSAARISGTIETDVKINALQYARAIRRGETIQSTDLQMAEALLSEMPKDAILHVEQVLGKSARRNLSYGDYPKMGELIAPTLVARNQPVIILLEQGPMRITTKGVALENGAQDEMIRVRNERSGKVIYARVKNAQTVETSL
ncbi:flagellar basal body P-ring formation protein FlgA [Candidatus Sumerlaeota bacterium]|nr:flagellar basal body P-ring formation protein FlgA [Candidatus Sumerlaeota bacterium]